VPRRKLHTAFFAFTPILSLLLAVACGPGSTEERVENARARYEAALEGWVVRDDPARALPEVVEVNFEDGLPPEEAVASTADGEEEPMPPPGPIPRDVTLNIRLWHNNPGLLPGITLDVIHADEHEREKETHRVWVDTSRLARGQEIQFDHLLRNVVVEAGDRFAVRVRHPVPAEERAAYQEFQQAQGGGE
jgi:hypothetical protein